MSTAAEANRLAPNDAKHRGEDQRRDSRHPPSRPPMYPRIPRSTQPRTTAEAELPTVVIGAPHRTYARATAHRQRASRIVYIATRTFKLSPPGLRSSHHTPSRRI
ncbi:hypothetical protein A0H81_14076 [Grifola frondosa]|uniref:Uncharacterized protein n=1 Tax=Grifola frondosa TaxID=5627 RepID=A0A1C7LM82_GRIFR|nr:hypothetical protein A0H81_14076 [Grifola frondosa]